MSQEDRFGFQELADKRLRMKLALQHLSLNQQKNAKLLTEWLDRQPEIADDDLSELMVALSSSLQSLTWYAATAPNLCLETTGDFLLDLGASQSEMELLTQAGKQIQPKSLGTWLQLTADGLNGGWYFPEPTTTYRILNIVADSPERELLLQWAETNKVIDCQQIRRAVIKSQPMTELFFSLPEVSLSEQMAIARAAFKIFELSWFGSELETTLEDLGVSEIGIVSQFIPEGISQLGIVIIEPSTTMVLTLCYLSEDFGDRQLAMFEGSLGVEKVDFLTLTQNSWGLATEIYYLL